MTKAVLFRSEKRFDAFRDRLERRGVHVTVLNFESQDWIEYDYGDTQILVYFPSFKFTSNYPLALYEAQDNLAFLHARHPHLRMFPDPNIIAYYSDKYRQFLFLKNRGYPYPETCALFSPQSLDDAERRLGYPMVLKNRYGAGGDFVFMVNGRAELEGYYRLSVFDLFNFGAARFFIKLAATRSFWRSLLRRRRMRYPFLSVPLLAQKYVTHERDLKTVVGGGRVVEAHWRHKASAEMWKVNIDGGGIGEWSHVPEEAISLSERLAHDLDASWINLDLMECGGRFLISEFSPVWHHYAYREKPSFVYKDDYNIPVPLETALDLETIIVDSLLRPPT